MWYTRKIIPTAVTLYLFHFGVGYHRAYVVDFQMISVLGELSVPLNVVNKRRLTCSFPLIVNRYLKRAEDQLQLHDIPLKLQELKEQCHSLTSMRRELKLNSIDALTKNLVINAEKKRRKFRTGEIDLSPDTA